jgi:hypothetical protein
MCRAPCCTPVPGVTKEVLSSAEGYRLNNPEQHRRRQFIEGLRAVAQFYEENPAAWYDGIHLTLSMYLWGRGTREILAQTVRAFGHCTTHHDHTNITVSRKFSEQVTLSVFAPRVKVCRRVLRGTETTEEFVEWKCDPLLDEDTTP